jgi:hypothetical protein
VDKFGRNYILTVGDEDKNLVTIEPPFTIEFDITRNTLTSANVCEINIYNLSLVKRNKLKFNISNMGEFRPVVLLAGYGDQLVTIFNGNISRAASFRQGVNMITQVSCFDGGFAFVNGESNLQFPAGTPTKVVIQSLIDTLPHVDNKGVIGTYIDKIPRSASYAGNTIKNLKEITGGGFFIDNGKANALRTNEYIQQDLTPKIITSDSGLLATPVLEQTIMHFDMVFEPQLAPGNAIIMKSSTVNNFNGLYKITGVKHRGMISGAVCGTLITTGQFFFDKLLTGVH